MLRIKNDLTMEMFKGDTGSFTLKIAKNGADYDFVTGDVVAFLMKRTLDQETYTISKEITTFVNGAAVITLEPADTTDLDTGPYFYSIKYTDDTGVVNTLVEEVEKFILLQGV